MNDYKLRVTTALSALVVEADGPATDEELAVLQDKLMALPEAKGKEQLIIDQMNRLNPSEFIA